jgi:hypothetical protein
MEQGVDIISNSTGSNGLSPMDGTGFTNDVVNEAAAAGILWVNAAGNEALSHYQGGFTDTDTNTIHEFFPDTETIPFIPYGPGYETSIILNWNDWQAADQDYDLILMDEAGNVLGVSEDFRGADGSLPVEGFLFLTNLRTITSTNSALRMTAAWPGAMPPSTCLSTMAICTPIISTPKAA